MRSDRKSWADWQGIPTGVEGEVIDGVRISEETRVTVFEYYREGIEVLQRILRNNYRSKGVDAVLFGVDTGNLVNSFKYAIYVSDAFLEDVNRHVFWYSESMGDAPLE